MTNYSTRAARVARARQLQAGPDATGRRLKELRGLHARCARHQGDVSRHVSELGEHVREVRSVHKALRGSLANLGIEHDGALDRLDQLCRDLIETHGSCDDSAAAASSSLTEATKVVDKMVAGDDEE
jgi:hypothetical protein